MANPKLRFSKQYPDWKFYQIKDIVEVNPYTAELPERFVYIDLESVDRGNLTATNIIDRRDAPSRAQRLIEKDDVLFQLVRPYQQNNLIYSDLCHLPAVASTGYAQLRPTKTVTCPSFLYTAIHTKTFLENVLCRCTGGAYPAINTSDLSEISLSMPCLEEQHKIAEFFTTLDEKIRICEAKIDSTERLLAGLMDALFKQKIRLKNSEGSYYPDWRKSTIGKEGSFHYGKSAPKWSLSDEATTPCVRYGDLYTKFRYKIDSVNTFTNIDKKDLVFSKGGEVLVPRVGEDPNDFCKCAYLPFEGIAIGEMVSIYESQHDGMFLSFYFNSQMRKEFAKYVEGGNVSNLYYTYLEDIEITIPSLEEQKAISEFLTDVVNKLDFLKQSKQKYITLKKAFMQRMFV